MVPSLIKKSTRQRILLEYRAFSGDTLRFWKLRMDASVCTLMPAVLSPVEGRSRRQWRSPPSKKEFGMSNQRTHIPQEEAFVVGEEDVVAIDDVVATATDRARFQHELLQKELDLLRARLDIIRSQVGVVAKSSVTWVNASARSQLSSYPWTKLGALAASSFLVTTALRSLR
jgi:hypothetical protein